jgi:hypothetical protein
MDNQAGQPSGGGADPAGGSQPGGDQASAGTPAPDSGQQGGGTPQPSSDQPWAGTPQPGGGQQWSSPPQPSSDQPWAGTPQPGGAQQWGGPPQPGGGQPWAGAPQPGGGQPFGGTPQPGGQYPGQPPIIAGTGTGRPRVRPGRIWYLVPALLIAGGIASVVFGFVSLGSKVDSFARVPLPAGGTVALNHSGGYVVYYEGPGADSGQIPSFNVRIAPAAPPAAVRRGSLQTYGSSVTYTIGTRQGRAVLTLQVAHPGKFVVEPSGAGAATAGSDLAFGQSLGGSIVSIVLPTIGLIFLGIASWIILFVIRLTRTRRAREQGY